MIDLTNETIVSEAILDAMGYPPARKLIARPSDRTVPFEIPAEVFEGMVAVLQMGLRAGGCAVADGLHSESFWSLAADVLMQDIHAEIESLSIQGFECEHEVVPDENLNPHIVGVVVCPTVAEAVALKMRLA